MHADHEALDRRMMKRALRLARRGAGHVEPNPMVGCVLVKHGRIVGEGYHHRFGGPHAEVFALRQAGRRARGATAYVTMEPCSYHGKTPPCCEALIRAGVARVRAGACDPNPRVDGSGLQRLREAGIDASAGLLEPEPAELIAPFRTFTLKRRPFVIAKWAQSLDGRIATRSGDSQWISGPDARRMVHRLRARVDAVLIGSGTLLADDPNLTARGVRVRRTACRVVLDTRLRFRADGRLARTASDVPVMLFTTAERADSRKARRLRELGVDVVGVPVSARGLRLRSILGRLHGAGMTNVLIEGGGRVLGSFFRAGLVDEAYGFVAAMIIADSTAPSVIDTLRPRDMTQVLRPTHHEWTRHGHDICCHMRFDAR